MRIAILTVSDGCHEGRREDRSGAWLEAWALERGYTVADRAVVPDEVSWITPRLLRWADEEKVDVVLTTGGTGFGPRDVTPEATRPLIQREAPGLAEAIRMRGAGHTPHAALSRGLVGIRGATLLANLPGSPAGVADGVAVLAPVLEHAVALLRGEDPPHTPPPPGTDGSGGP